MSEPGSTLRDGRYAVCGEIGHGGSGVTLEAVDKQNGTLVAIKRFEVRGARSWKDVELAEREARVLSRLSHPLLPAAIDHFEENGALFLVMERIDGKPLGALGRLEQSEVVRFLRDADAVLAYLHGRSPPVIHRDIKPGNVIRREGGVGPSFVLVDFGSVRDSLKPAGGSTVVGTFGYMAPEQFQGRALPQSDVYAVGATALRMLSGEEPEHLPHRGLAIDVGAVLGADHPLTPILERMLDPNPDSRPARIGPLLETLAPAPARGRKARREAKRRQRGEDKRAEKRERRQRRETRPSELPPLVRTLFIIGLALARVAVAMSLRVVVPTLLVALSLLFGAGLRRAASAASQAGVRADEAMRDAAARLRGRAPAARIEVEPPQEAAPPAATKDVMSEVESAVDEAADEIERALRRRRESSRREL